MGRPKNTILLVLPKKVYLADFTGGKTPSLLRIREKPRTASTISGAIDDAFIGEKIGKNILIFASELWVQEIPMAQRVVEDLKENELQQTLSFEVEQFSGIGGSDSSVGLQMLGKQDDNTVFWVVQLPKNQLAHIEKIVQRIGSKLIGIAHPGAVPHLIEPLEKRMTAEQWHRVELWPDAVLCVFSQENQIPLLHVINCAPQYGNWQEDAENWFKQLGVEHLENALIFSRDGGALPQAFPTIVNLDIEAHFSRWVQVWSKYLLQKFPSYLPIIQSPKLLVHAGIQWKKILWAPLFLVLVTAMGSWFLSKKIDSLSKRKQVLQATTLRLENARQELRQTQEAFRRAEATLREKQNEKNLISEIFIRHRQRYSALFLELSQQAPEDVVVLEMMTQDSEILLKGFCLLPHLADEYAQKLKASLKVLDWEVGPAMKVILKNSRVWEFQIILKPAPIIAPIPETLPANSLNKKTG